MWTEFVVLVSAALVGADPATPASGNGGSEAKVRLLRVPDGGIQPQVEVDGEGRVHLVYFKGDAGAGDVFYVRSDDGGERFSPPLRVNRVDGSVIAAGNVRGAHLALGKGGRPHVAWMGSKRAEEAAGSKESPMLVTRLDDSGAAFEPERNVIAAHLGLDGGGSIAADGKGGVYAVWHAPEAGGKGEEARRVWVAASRDEGKSFAAETLAGGVDTGCCPCCGIRGFADRRGNVFVLYRSARGAVHRDMHLLASKDRGATFAAAKLHEWSVGQCVMSTAAFAETKDGVVLAWETKGEVYCAQVDPATLKCSVPAAPSVQGAKRRFPALAANERGEFILAWTEGMAWRQGGDVAWQVFDASGKLLAAAGAAGKRPGVPVWSVVAVFAGREGGFVVVY
jgi:hypothetical protein